MLFDKLAAWSARGCGCARGGSLPQRIETEQTARASKALADASMVFEPPDSNLEGLILAQNERWRRGLGMQVERGHAGWQHPA